MADRKDWSFESFYRSFADTGQYTPMADLMPALLQELQRRGLTAYTSLDTFCISRHTDWPEWSENAKVRISPEHTGQARIIFDEAESEGDEDSPIVDFRDLGELVPYESAMDYLQPLLDRL